MRKKDDSGARKQKDDSGARKQRADRLRKQIDELAHKSSATPATGLKTEATDSVTEIPEEGAEPMPSRPDFRSFIHRRMQDIRKDTKD